MPVTKERLQDLHDIWKAHEQEYTNAVAEAHKIVATLSMAAAPYALLHNIYDAETKVVTARLTYEEHLRRYIDENRLDPPMSINVAC